MKTVSKKFLFLLSIFTFSTFIYYSYLVAKERFEKLDFDLTVKFQDHISRQWDYPFSILSIIGSVEITGIIWLTILFYLLLKRFWLASLGMFLLPTALFIELFGKVFVHHPAPPFLFYRGVISFNFPSNFVHTDYSYPSGHMTRTAFLIVFIMTYLYLRHSAKKQLAVQLFLVIFIIAMAVSRIYLAEHWTSDVIGGTLIGASFGLLAGLFILSKKEAVKS